MGKQILLALIAVLLVVGSVAMYLAGGDGPHLAPSATTTDGTADAVPAPVGTTADASAPTPPDAPPTQAAERAVAAVFDEGNQRPLPDEPNWVTVKVVDQATGSPLAGALVRWTDEKAWEWLTEKLGTEPAGELQWQSEQFAKLAGWSTRSDAQGIARVTLHEATTVHAQHGDLYGRLQLTGDTVAPIGGRVIELVPDAAITVRVLDANGAPAVDVPIGLAILDKNGRPLGWYGWMAMARTRAPDGVATLAHLQVQATELRRMDARPEQTWHVRLHLPGITDPGVAFDPAAPPKEPIELRLPPCGSMRVSARFAGKPVPGFRTAWISHESESRERRQLGANIAAPVGPDGTARFPWLPLGLDFAVNGNALGNISTKAAGPRLPGQEVEVVLEPPPNAMLLAGRLLLRGNTPAAELAVSISVRGPQLSTSPDVRTDRDGRFLVSLGEPRKDNKVDRISFEVQRRNTHPLRAELTGRTLRVGVDDLGDITVTESELLVAGRVLADGNPFTLPINVWIEREEQRQGGTRWRHLDNQSVSVEKDGTFTALGNKGVGRLRVNAAAERLLPVTPIEFVAGAKEVVVTVEPGLGLAATVLLPPKATPVGLTAVLVPANGTVVPTDTRRGDRLTRNLEGARGDRHDVRWPAVSPGNYTLELRLFTEKLPLLTIADVVLPLPAAGDPRLVDIDLRPYVRSLAIELLDGEGKRPSDTEGAVFPMAQANPEEWLGFSTWTSPMRLLLPKGPYDLQVCVRNFRPQPLRGDADQVTVRLLPWPQLVVRVPDMPTLPERTRVNVSLQPTDAVTGSYRTPWNSGNRAELFAAPTNSVPVQEGKATVAIGDGLSGIRLTVNGNRRQHVIEGFEPKQVLSTTPEVTLTIPKEQWDKAIEVVKQPPKGGGPEGGPAGAPWINRNGDR